MGTIGSDQRFDFYSRLPMKSNMQNLHMRDMKATTVSKRHLRKQIYNFGSVKQSYDSTFIHFILIAAHRETEYYDYGHGEAQETPYEAYGKILK